MSGEATTTYVVPLLPVREFLRSDQIPPVDAGAYGLVVLKAKATSASRSKLLMVCQSLIAHFVRNAEVPANVPMQDRMVTVWPVTDPDADLAKSDDCNFVLDHYDLYAADTAIADAEKQHQSFQSEGPYLIGWSPSATRGQPDKLVLVMDLSAANNQAAIDRVFQFWKDEIIHDPARWRDGFSVEGVREKVKDFTDHYGADILAAVKLVGL
jgi:hypothetical protein